MPLASRLLGVLSQLSDRGAEVCLDAVRLLEAVGEQELDERSVLRAPCGSEIRREPGRGRTMACVVLVPGIARRPGRLAE